MIDTVPTAGYRALRLSALLVAAALAPAPAMGDSWRSGGPYGGTVQALAIDPRSPSTLYAGLSYGDGVFRSTDGGLSWVGARSGLPNEDIRCLAVDPTNPSTLFACTPSEVYRSTDGARSWSLPRALALNVLVAHPSTSTRLFAARRDGTLLRSTDVGVSWQRLLDDVDSTPRLVATMMSLPGNPPSLFATATGGIYRSTDAGDSWSGPGAGVFTAPVTFALDPGTPSTVLAADERGSMFRSTDLGDFWARLSSGFPNQRVMPVAIDPASPTTLYGGLYGLYGGLYKSTDSGASWAKSAAPIPNAFPVALVIDPVETSRVYLGTDGNGVYLSTDAGAGWMPASHGLARCDVTSLAIGSSAVLYAGTSRGGLFRSTDGGGTWDVPASWPGTPEITSLAVDPENGAQVLAGSGSLFASGGLLLFTADAGLTWTKIPLGVYTTKVFAIAFDFRRPSTVFAAVDQGVRRSTDYGRTWEAAGGLGVYARALALGGGAAGSIVYAGTYDRGVLWSTDSGQTWTRWQTGLTRQDIRSLAADPGSSGEVFAGTGLGLFRSTDGGASWAPAGLSSFSIVGLAHRSTPGVREVFAATDAAGVWRSTNAGASWVPVNRGLESLRLGALAADREGTFVLAGGKGVWRAYAPETTPGDVTGDGRLDVFDLVVLASLIAGNVVPDQPPFLTSRGTGDLDGDGDLDVLDLVALAMRIVEG